jgi:hypothetical protein
MVDVRKGMPGRKLDAEVFEKRYLSQFTDPSFEPLRADLKAIVSAAWNAYSDGRKAPRTRTWDCLGLLAKAFYERTLWGCTPEGVTSSDKIAGVNCGKQCDDKQRADQQNG